MNHFGFFSTNIRLFKPVIENLANDYRCDVHQMLLGIRENKSNWLDLYAPGNIGCDDDGQLWSIMVCIIY